MKSSIEDLKKRGLPAEDVITAMARLSADEYKRLLASPQADVRSAAAIHLRPVVAAVPGEMPVPPEVVAAVTGKMPAQPAATAAESMARWVSAPSAAEVVTEMMFAQPTAQQALVWPAKDTVTDALLTRLAVEKCLYTRLAICETLEKGDAGTARKMVPYLGKIGNNQHRCLPEKVSAKKSFPLPRDMIARTLGRMDISIYPVLTEVLRSENDMQVREMLDAVGYMVFYHQELANMENVRPVLSLAGSDDAVIVWKMILCLSAFPIDESVRILTDYANRADIIGQEALRSLRIIRQFLSSEACQWHRRPDATPPKL